MKIEKIKNLIEELDKNELKKLYSIIECRIDDIERRENKLDVFNRRVNHLKQSKYFYRTNIEYVDIPSVQFVLIRIDEIKNGILKETNISFEKNGKDLDVNLYKNEDDLHDEFDFDFTKTYIPIDFDAIHSLFESIEEKWIDMLLYTETCIKDIWEMGETFKNMNK